jgi:Zn-dependent peptidase ImmA (M78 family)
MPERTRSDPRSCAEDLLERYSIRTPPVPVERIAKALGAEIRRSSLDSALSGMVFVRDGIAIIGVNAMHHPNRQRFTIAHEIGHLELHRKQIESEVHVDRDFPILLRGPHSADGTDEFEKEANLFAAELLMPRRFMEQALQDKSFDIDDERPIMELARKFQVSKQAMEYRIRNLT